MNRTKLAVAAVAVIAIGSVIIFDLTQYLSFAAIENTHLWLADVYLTHPLAVAVGYFLGYVAVAALSIPGAAVMTLLGGAVFGVISGTVLVSFASTLGATLAFLFARFLLRDSVERRFSSYMTIVNRGVDREGGLYLFAMRLVPAIPFVVVNLVAALTQIRTLTFIWVSQLGMLPATIVYVNAGKELGALESASDVLSPAFILSFVALGILPLASSRIIRLVRTRKVQRDFQRPKQFDRNLVVIGAGAAGLVSAYIAAAVKAKVTLVERHRMGGDCLNTGCVPSKTLIRTARLAHEARRAGEFGLAPLEPHVNFTAVMDRVRRVIAAIEPHDSVERYTELGVECRLGDARIVSPWCVEVDGEPISTRAIVIATGARPFVPPIRGLDEVPYFTSDTIWEMKEQPRRLTVLGGGPIGCELAQCFARFGTAVTIVEMADTVLVRDEPEMAATVAESLRADGVKLRVGARAQAVTPAPDGGGSILCTGDDGTESHVDFDAILVAVGRRPNVHGFGLEEIGINAAPEAGGVVETDDYLATLHPNIFACGDVAGPYQFTHAAAHQAWYAAVNALFGQFRQFAVDYRVIPRVTYTEPELASVGIGEAQARADGVEYEITRYGLDDLDRAIVDGEARGEVKVLTAPGSDRILGAHIVGAHAGELICAFTIAMRHKLGLKKILGTIHPYPTMMEANKYVAGVWQRDHAPAKLLEWLSRYHAWRRG